MGSCPCTLLRTSRPAISPRSLLQSGTPTAHERVALPLLPSGPGGVRRFPLRGAQPSTPPREAHSTRSALEREFNPAEADCGLQGTANSPSSTANRRFWRRGRDSNPGHRGYPCTAFPVPHLRPLGHPSAFLIHRDCDDHRRKLAEGRGFEPPRDLLGPYPISSRTPSTGLGHPSAPSISIVCFRVLLLTSESLSLLSRSFAEVLNRSQPSERPRRASLRSSRRQQQGGPATEPRTAAPCSVFANLLALGPFASLPRQPRDGK